MSVNRVVLLNTSILTAFGTYSYMPCTVEDAQHYVKSYDVLSAIGHDSTAVILSEVLGIPVATNRIIYKQEENDLCLVFKLRGRAPEGVILTREEIEQIGYDFGTIRVVIQ